MCLFYVNTWSTQICRFSSFSLFYITRKHSGYIMVSHLFHFVSYQGDDSSAMEMSNINISKYILVFIVFTNIISLTQEDNNNVTSFICFRLLFRMQHWQKEQFVVKKKILKHLLLSCGCPFTACHTPKLYQCAEHNN